MKIQDIPQLPDDHIAAITGKMLREAKEEIASLKATAEKAERDRKEQVDWNRSCRIKWGFDIANLARANREQSEEVASLKKDNLDLADDLAQANAEKENLKHQISEMQSYKDRWEREAWDTLSMLNKERDKNKALSSALTEQEACTGREILKTQAQKHWTEVWKDQANHALSKFAEAADQVVDLKRQLDQKQARAKRQTALLKALRKEVGAEAFDKAYRDSLGAEKRREMTKIVDNLIASYLSDVYTKSTRNLFTNLEWRHGVEQSNPMGGSFVWRSEVIK